MSEEKDNPEVQLTKPYVLTKRDHELVEEECEIQGATSEKQKWGMREALKTAKKFAFETDPTYVTKEEILDLERNLAELIEVDVGGDWRNHDMITTLTGSVAKAEELPDRMPQWAETMAENLVPADELYQQFEYNHPRDDGNGRNGWCTWAISKKWQTGVWPEELPPKYGETKQFESSFGPIERDEE